MTQYKVGDVAALFSKPKEPTSESGKKLQSLFKEFHSKNKSEFDAQEASSKWNNKSKAGNEESGDQKIFKKNKKRKYSATIDSESNLKNESNSKKFKGTDVQEIKVKSKRKNNNNFHDERVIPQKKNKTSKFNSFNGNSFIKCEVNKSSENEFKLADVSRLNNSPKAKKVKSSFIKKSKCQTLDDNKSFDIHPSETSKVNIEEAVDSNDESFKEEIKEFIKKNSKKSNKKNSANANSEKELQKKSVADNSLFVKNYPNKKVSKDSFYIDNSPEGKSQTFGFIRRPKKRNKAANSSFGENDNENFKTSVEDHSDSDDALFKSENEEFAKKTKKFKKFSGNIENSVQKSPRNVHIKREPDFVKLMDKKPEGDELNRTLFVGNLPLNTRRKDLKSLFSSFGDIAYIRFKGVETDKAKIFSETASKSLNTNYAADSLPGFIVFQEKESAVNALALCGTLFKNRHITVDFAMPVGSHKLYDDKRSIFIGNLPFGVKDESIWNAFSECGKIEGVRVVRDKETGIGKGFGYVLFSTAKSKANALSLKDLEIDGRSIRIKAVDSNKRIQKKSTTTATATTIKRDTFKSRAIRLKKKHNNTNSRKSIKKLVKKEKYVHNKKKVAALLQKSLK